MNKNTNLFEVAEVSVTYKNKVPTGKKYKIVSSQDIYTLMRPIFQDVINHHEEFYIILLNSGNCVLGVSKIAQGGIAETSVDVRIIFQTALKANATSIILAHNHPSGNLTPSWQDRDLTKKIVNAGKLINITVLDHLIITDSGYYSFADEGVM